MIITTNDYWDQAAELVVADGRGLIVPRWNWDQTGKAPVDPRHELVHRYSWSITSPDAVEFVAQASGGRLIDPMAGTGWWGWCLSEHGVDVASSDCAPGDNPWHRGGHLYGEVARVECEVAVGLSRDRTLFLSWPPYEEDTAARALAAYQGKRVIYLGEDEGGCTGDEQFHQTLDTEWELVDTHPLVRWEGVYDRVHVYDRKAFSN